MKRHVSMWGVGIVIMGVLFLAGCESKRLKDENARLTQEVQTLSQEKSGLEAKAAQLTQEKGALEQQTAELQKKVTELEQKKMTKKAPAKKPGTKTLKSARKK